MARLLRTCKKGSPRITRGDPLCTGSAAYLASEAVADLQTVGTRLATEALQADGGIIQLTARELVYLNESKITATVGGGAGRGGGEGSRRQRHDSR